MLAAIAHVQTALAQRVAAANVSSAINLDTRKHQEEFNKHMLTDTGEVINKLVTAFHADISGVLEEVLKQSQEFWTTQFHKHEEHHKALSTEQQKKLDQASAQLEEMTETYTSVVQELNVQLTEARTCLEEQEEREKAKVLHLSSQLKTSEASLEETSNTFKGLLQDMNKQLVSTQALLKDAELKWQQKRLVLGQMVETQQKQLQEQATEIESLKAQLKQAHVQLDGSEARNKKLTAVSQHLLGKHQMLKASSGAAAGTTTAGAVTGSGAEHDIVSETETSAPSLEDPSCSHHHDQITSPPTAGTRGAITAGLETVDPDVQSPTSTSLLDTVGVQSPDVAAVTPDVASNAETCTVPASSSSPSRVGNPMPPRHPQGEELPASPSSSLPHLEDPTGVLPDEGLRMPPVSPSTSPHAGASLI